MSTSKTYQQSLADAGSETRPPMLERGSYIPWASRFRRYLNRKRDNRKWLLKALDEGPYVEDLLLHDMKLSPEYEFYFLFLMNLYNTVDACTSAKDMWKRVERLIEIIDEETSRMMVPHNSEDPQVSAMLLLCKSHYSNFLLIQQIISGRASSNTRNQAIIQGDRVNIQSRNSGNTGRNSRRAYVQEEVVEGMNAPKETENVQRTLRTPVCDSKYFMEQMLLAKQDEDGVILTNEQDDFLFADASRMEEIEELGAKICLMARIQPADHTSDDGPSYESAFISEVQSSSIDENNEPMYPTHTKIINSTIGDDQINSNIKFDSFKGNVNSGSVEKDTTYFVPQKELSVEQKYFSSSSIPSVKIPVSKNMPSESPLIKELDKIKDQVKPILNELKVYLDFFQNLFQRDIKEMKDVFESTESELDELEKQNDLLKDQLLEASLKHDVELFQSLIKERDNAKMEYKKLFDSIKKTRSQTQKEMDELIVHVSEKTYAYGAIRAENQNLLSTISELKTRLEKVEKGKSVNTKFDKTNGYQSLLCVTPLNKHAFQKKTDVHKTEENHVVSKPVTLQTSPTKQTGANQNTHVIRPGMYRVVTTQESQTNKTKSALSSTGMNATSRVRRPMSRDSHVAHSVLDNSKKAAKNVAVYVRKNKQTDNTSANVIPNKENVIDDVVANASKAKILLCVSSSKTRFSEKKTQSKTLDTTLVESASKAKDKVVQIVLWVVDNSCSKHMTGDR
ncbi:hypothetical protein Tco_0740803, partial [Tanacetum coccineum]